MCHLEKGSKSGLWTQKWPTYHNNPPITFMSLLIPNLTNFEKNVMSSSWENGVRDTWAHTSRRKLETFNYARTHSSHFDQNEYNKKNPKTVTFTKYLMPVIWYNFRRT